jgi:hypothetical protein
MELIQDVALSKHDQGIRDVISHDLNSWAPGGLVKRLDEHRELWELLKTEADFCSTHWWVAGWFADTDAFLSRLVAEADLEKSSGTFLRPRPEYDKD